MRRITKWPEPQIGYWIAECCLYDLEEIKTQADLDSANERIKNNEECGDLMVFESYDDALIYLETDD